MNYQCFLYIIMISNILNKMTTKQINQLQDENLKEILKAIKKLGKTQNKIHKLFKDETNDRNCL